MIKCVVSGASRGIGSALCRNLAKYLDVDITMISRNQPENISELRSRFPKSKFDFIEADLSCDSDLAKLEEICFSKVQSCDFLINNAATYPEKTCEGRNQSILDIDLEIFSKTFRTNTIAPFFLIKTFLPQMISKNFGRIVNVSSGMSRVDEYDQYSPAYRASKRALNGITLSVSHLVHDKDIVCSSVCPGWVQTQMGGISAIRSADEGCLGIIWCLLSTDNSISGGFFRDHQRLSFEHTTKSDHLDQGLPQDFVSVLERRAFEFRKKYC